MSIQFNDTTTYKGLVQFYEKEIGAERGFVADDEDRLKEFTADANLALDDFLTRAFKAAGTWNFDDSNHSKYPIITTNIVSGQRSYAFTVDQQNNIILDIHRVLIAGPTGGLKDIPTADQQTSNNGNSETTKFVDGLDSPGVPTCYDKTANGIFFDYIPNYSRSGALKVLINREGSYFTYDAPTKKPGVPGLLHKYFYLKPAMDYARRNSLASYDRLALEVAKTELEIDDTFKRRQKDEKGKLMASYEDNE